MGSGNSKTEKNEALRLCKHRRKFIKQAIDSRYSLAAAHVSYVQSLRNIGTALRRYAEAEVLIESSLSTSATELDKTPLHSSYPSPSPSHIADVSDSPLQNGSPVARMSYMRSGGSAAVTVMVNPVSNNFVQDESVQPPPPPFESGSWDYFDTTDDGDCFRFLGVDGVDINFDDVGGWGKEKNEEGRDGNSGAATLPRIKKSVSEISRSSEIRTKHYGQPKRIESDSVMSGGIDSSHAELDGELKQDRGIHANRLALEPFNSKLDKTMVDKGLDEEREDPSEFITHRAKDFLSSIKYIEHRFVRASEAGREISRMLEANKIRVGYSEAKGRPSASAFITAFQSLCPKGNGSLASRDSTHHMTKVITWKRSTSSLSSSSRNPLTGASKDDADESGSDFVEEFCMIAGSHSSTLDRLYAWERKLYDEVKASEIIRKEYDSKCDQLRHQFAKDQSAQIIDKTRAVVKDLHSRIRVALHSVDSISKRIEKMRDEELQPQLIEFIQGLIRMWKAMLECHHAQYITISLAYHSRSSAGTLQGESCRQILDQLQQEVECFGLSFTNWINSHTSYIEALNAWLQHCILEPRERCRGRRPFSPRRALAPPIFVLCRDWCAGIKALPYKELSDAIKSFLSDLYLLKEQHAEELLKKQQSLDQENGEETGCRDAEKKDDASSNLHCLHASLTKVLDRLTRFSEASLKMYEDIKQKSETARTAYTNCRPVRF